MLTPTPTATLGPRINIGDFTLPNSISIPSGIALTELSTYISIPTVINGITLPTGIVIHYTVDPTTTSSPSSSSALSSSISSISSSPSSSPSATPSPSNHHSNTALLAGIFTAVALLSLLLLLLAFWLLRRRRRRKQHDSDLAAAGAVPRGTVSRTRFWHMRGGDGASSRMSRSIRSSSSEHLAESEMVFRPIGDSEGVGAKQRLLAADHAYPTEALMSPNSPVSFDRVTHPDGSYFPTMYTPAPAGRSGLYGMNAAGIGAGVAFGAGAAALAKGHHNRRRSTTDPFADDPRHSRTGHSDTSSISSTADVGMDPPYAHRAGFGYGREGTDDPSFVFGESFLSPGHGHGAMNRMPTAGGTHPPLTIPAPVLAHMGSSTLGPTVPHPTRFMTNTTQDTKYESAHTSFSASDSSSSGHGGAGPRASDDLPRKSSGTEYGGWLTGGMGGVPTHDYDHGYSNDSGELSSSQIAELYAHRASLPNPVPPFASRASRSLPSSGSSPMESIPERPSPPEVAKEAGTPAALGDQSDYRPARRLSVVNPTP